MPPKWKPSSLLESPDEFADTTFAANWHLKQPDDFRNDVDFDTCLYAAMYQHHVAARVRSLMRKRRIEEKELAKMTPGVGEDAWRGVLRGDLLLKVEHLGAACVALGHLVLPSRDDLVHEVESHNARGGKLKVAPPATAVRSGFLRYWDIAGDDG